MQYEIYKKDVQIKYTRKKVEVYTLIRYEKMISQAHFMVLKSNEKIFCLNMSHVAATGFICKELYMTKTKAANG